MNRDELERWGHDEFASRLAERAGTMQPAPADVPVVSIDSAEPSDGRRRSLALAAAAIVLLAGGVVVWRLTSPTSSPVRTGDRSTSAPSADPTERTGPRPTVSPLPDGATTTTTAVAVPASCQLPADPTDEQLDRTADLQLARIQGFEPDTRLLHFDPVGWGGPTADADWSVIDDTAGEMTAPVAARAEAWLALTDDGDPDLDRYDPDTASSLLSTLNQNDPLAWLTFEDGAVTRICEQYHP